MSADTAIRTIRLTERQARFLDEQVAAGRHPSESDVVQEALLRRKSTPQVSSACSTRHACEPQPNTGTTEPRASHPAHTMGGRRD